MKLYGKGTISEIEKGRKYRLALSAGKDPVTGKYVKHQETFIGTKRQAELRIEQIRRELEQGKAVNADKITLGEWIEKYLTYRQGLGKLRPNTLETERHYSKHIAKYLGASRLADLTPIGIETAYASMRSAGVGDTTICQVHKLLKAILKYAVNNDMIMRNPCDRVESPRKPKPQRNALDPTQADRLITVCTSGVPSANKTAVLIAIATGARLGEVLGLTWGNVSMTDDRPYIHIVRQYTSAGELAPLKTDRDDAPNPGRIVPIDKTTVAILKAWKAEQRRQLLQFGIEPGTNTPIVSNVFGGFTDHHNLENWFRSFCASHGFGRYVSDDGREIVQLQVEDDASPYPQESYLIEWRDADGWPCDADGKRYSRTNKRPTIKRHYSGLKFHELRHTHFTLRLASGMDIPTAQALGGWSTPQMLLNVYAHPVARNVWASAGFMDKLTAKRG